MKATSQPIHAERIERCIVLVRSQKALLDFQLAELYQVETKALNLAVKRNLERFPEDFMFRLTWEEVAQLSRSQIVTSISEESRSAAKIGENRSSLRSQIVTLKRGQHQKFLPYAFTTGISAIKKTPKKKRLS